MKELPRYMGLNEFVDVLSHVLAPVPLRRRYPGSGGLTRALARTTGGFFRQRLQPLKLRYPLWQDALEQGSSATMSSYAFATEFVPDLGVEVSNLWQAHKIRVLISGAKPPPEGLA